MTCSGRAVRATLAVAVLFAGIAAGQVTVWRSQWDAGRDRRDEILAMALTPEGDVVATGFSRISYSPLEDEISTVKFSAEDGEVVWSRAFRARDSTVPTAIAIDSAGNVFVTGNIRVLRSDTSEWVVLKYLPDGTEAWRMRYHYLLTDAAMAVVPDGANGCYVAGYSSNSSGNLDMIIAQYPADDVPGWRTRLNGAADGNDAAYRLVSDDAGHLYAAGYTWTGTTDGNAYWLVKLEAANGDTVWTRTYNGSAGPGDPRDDRAYGLALGPGGDIYVAGRAGEAGTWYDATTVCWAPDGTRRWVNRFDAGHNTEDCATEIAVDPTGNAYCGGHTIAYYPDSERDFLLFKIDANGNTAWYQVFDPGLEDDDSCTAVALDDKGNVYAAGAVPDVTGCPDWVVFKFSPDGTRRWMHSSGVYDEDDSPFSLLLDSLGHVYVGGTDYYQGSEDFAVLKLGQRDVSATQVLQPTDTLRLWAEVRPRARVRNHSSVALSFPVWLYIGSFYFDARYVADLAPYDSAEVEFAPWQVRDIGEHSIVCFTAMPGDQEPANDTIRASVTTVPGWELLAPMPQTEGSRQRDVKDGGSLVCYGDTLVFGLKGNNTVEFYCYDVRRDTWLQADSVPRQGPSGRAKRVKKGARLTTAPGRVFALKGNNTDDFLCYPVSGDSGWLFLAPYPPGGGRRVKGGGGLAYVASRDRIYSSKGANTREFFAYDLAANEWLTMADVHPGPKGRKVKQGSCLAYDGGDTIYLLKANYQEFCAYSIAGDTWIAKPALPFSAYGRKRKVKKDGALAFDPVTRRVWASKGGKSSEWWYFDVSGDTWVEALQDTIPMGPSGKAPAAGSAVAYGAGKVYFLKGNKTLEFWRYNADLPLHPGGGSDEVMAGASVPVLPSPELSLMPNPFADRAQLRFSLPVAGRVRLVLFDVSGREALCIVNEERKAGEHRVALTGAGLARGVYFVRLVFDTPSGTAVAGQKVVLLESRP
ncbi:MAG: SBBP repeat-containing protein [bacterium]